MLTREVVDVNHIIQIFRPIFANHVKIEQLKSLNYTPMTIILCHFKGAKFAVRLSRFYIYFFLRVPVFDGALLQAPQAEAVEEVLQQSIQFN